MRKTKLITALLTAFMITAVFLTPITAYANEDTETQNEETEIIVDNPDATNEDYISEDIDELIDISDASDVYIDEPPNESAVPDNSKPFTPDGQASVVDLAYESDGKMFYTFKTPAGNVFYLVIDRERGTDNVYFLNAVTEDDLLALAENSDKKGSTSAIPTTDPSTTEPDGETSENPDNPNAETDNPPAKKSNMGMIIFILIGVAAVGITAYYIKVIRPKQQGDIDDEDEDIPDEDDGEEMQFEDQPDESDDEYEDSDDSDEDS